MKTILKVLAFLASILIATLILYKEDWVWLIVYLFLLCSVATYIVVFRPIRWEKTTENKNKRSPFLGEVGGIPVANRYYSGDLKKMTIEQLISRKERLERADESDTDSDEAFMGRTREIDAINAEIQTRLKKCVGPPKCMWFSKTIPWKPSCYKPWWAKLFCRPPRDVKRERV